MRRADENRGDVKEWRRMRAWELSQGGRPQQEIAEVLGVSAGAVSQWLTIGREQGEEALRGKVAKGPACRLSAEQEAQLPALLDQGAEAYGFRGNVWTRRSGGRDDPETVWSEVSPGAYESST